MEPHLAPRKRKRESGPANPRPDSPDRISALPDELLVSILSLLPIKDSARTSTLSSRWRHVWTISPINVDDRLLDSCIGGDGDADYYASLEKSLARSRDIVSRILSSHRGPIRSCRLSKFYESRFYETADAHIATLAKKGIKELILHFSCHQRFPYTMPSSIAFCKSLSKLSLQNCRFMKPPFPSTSFPNLKDLQMKGVELSDKMIHGLLATCLCLESLDLSGQCDASLIQVSSSTLCKLCLKFYEIRPKSIIIKDAPNLKQLLLGETVTNCDSFVVLHAPNLELLGFVAFEARLLQFGNSFIRREPRRISAHPPKLRPILIDISSMLKSIKTLAIRVMFSDLATKKMLPAFLRCFPCLESLDLVLVDNYFGAYDICWEKLEPFDFIEHLKTVTIKHFDENYYKVEFAKFLVLNAKVLKKMTLLSWERLTLKWKETMSRQLCLDYKVSSELEVIFIEDSRNNTNFSLWNKLIE